MIVRDNVLLRENDKKFSQSSTATFEKQENELMIVKTLKPIWAIESIRWSVNAVGYVEVFWRNVKQSAHKRIFVLSGNGEFVFEQGEEILRTADRDWETLLHNQQHLQTI